MPPLVTVILTVYKRTEYIRQAIDCVLAQTFRDFEILVTDDSDNAVIQSICSDYSGSGLIQYRSNQPRLGVVGNLKAAIAETKGKYISILNDDDFWSPTFLETLVAALETHPDCVLAFSDIWIVDSTGQVDANGTEKTSALYLRDKLAEGVHHDAPRLVVESNSITTAMGSVFLRSALKIDDIAPEAAGSYDFWVACLLAATGRPFYYIPDRLTYYRVHPAMETARQDADCADSIAFTSSEMLRRDFFPDMRPAIEKGLARALFVSGLMKLRYGNAADARSAFINALKLRFAPKPLAGVVISFLPHPILSKLSKLSFGKG
ncbi:MAG TPA: glycosyltransferase [Chthoniobacterales bacterium]